MRCLFKIKKCKVIETKKRTDWRTFVSFNAEIKGETLEKLYKVSSKIYENFIKWIGQFGLIMGGLFVGYYSILTSDSKNQTHMHQKLLFIIEFIGFLASLCWFISMIGYIKTINCYNRRIKRIEKHLVNNNYWKYIYSLPELYYIPSTKIASCALVIAMLIAWSVILLNNFNVKFCVFIR